MTEKRRWMQASHERVSRQDRMLFRLVHRRMDMSVSLFSGWKSCLFLWWKEAAAASARSVLLFAITRRVQTILMSSRSAP